MKTTLLKFKHQNLDLFNAKYKDVSILEQIKYALTYFYSTPCHHKKETPKEWNPLFIHFSCGIFDPFRVGPQEYGKRNIDELFEPWKDASGLARTRIFLNKTKKLMDERQYHKNKDNAFIHQDINHIMSLEFIITRELVSSNQDIIGFFHLKTKTFKRYFIKDVRKLCELLRFSNQDFTRIFGHSEEFKIYPQDMSKEEFNKTVSGLITDASDMKIQNEHILEMLTFFRETNTVVSFFA